MQAQSPPPHPPTTIGIITFYRQQVDHLRSILAAFDPVAAREVSKGPFIGTLNALSPFFHFVCCLGFWVLQADVLAAINPAAAREVNESRLLF